MRHATLTMPHYVEFALGFVITQSRITQRTLIAGCTRLGTRSPRSAAIGVHGCPSFPTAKTVCLMRRGKL